jgi:hypothetical protein
MLGHDTVRCGAMGGVLAQHLLEHLPFEADPDAAIASVVAVAAAGLLDGAARERLWRAAQNRPHYLIGWLQHEPHTLPPATARELPAAVAAAAAAGHPEAALLARCASATGQGFLRALALALEKPPTHDATFRILDVTAAWFADARAALPAGVPPEIPGVARATLQALHELAGTGRAAAEPILGRTTAVGPLMRRHLAPVLQPLLRGLQQLQETA